MSADLMRDTTEAIERLRTARRTVTADPWEAVQDSEHA